MHTDIPEHAGAIRDYRLTDVSGKVIRGILSSERQDQVVGTKGLGPNRRVRRGRVLRCLLALGP